MIRKKCSHWFLTIILLGSLDGLFSVAAHGKTPQNTSKSFKKNVKGPSSCSAVTPISPDQRAAAENFRQKTDSDIKINNAKLIEGRQKVASLPQGKVKGPPLLKP